MHPLRKNKKVVGLMKDECNGKIITHFAGLRAKMYSFLLEEKDQIAECIKKVKGVKSNVVESSIDFDHFLNCLFNYTQETREQRRICSHFHNIYTEKETKLALSPFDDKRCLIENCTDTYAWGHKNLEK